MRWDSKFFVAFLAKIVTQRYMKILVTGGGGFLGRYVVKKLLAKGYSVRVLGRSDQPDLSEKGGALAVRGSWYAARSRGR